MALELAILSRLAPDSASALALWVGNVGNVGEVGERGGGEALGAANEPRRPRPRFILSARMAAFLNLLLASCWMLAVTALENSSSTRREPERRGGAP